MKNHEDAVKKFQYREGKNPQEQIHLFQVIQKV